MAKLVKRFALLLACLMIFTALAACTGTDDSTEEGTTSEPTNGGSQNGEGTTSEPTNGGSQNDEENESVTTTPGEEDKENDTKPASVGLRFSSSGDGSCYVSVGTCTDADIVIPSTSPDGDLVKNINYGAFSGCSNITSVYIPNSVTSLASSAFAKCTSLTSVTLPNSVKTMSSYAFNGCTSLTTFTFSSSMKTIQNNVFNGCTNLSTVNLPESIGTIKSDAFNGCSSLADINFAGTKAQWEAVTKENRWDAGTGNYTVHCSDGDIAKAQ